MFSPAVATDAATPGGWLDRFVRGARACHYRVNFITVHWYGGDFRAKAAVGELKSYLKAIHARYKLRYRHCRRPGLRSSRPLVTGPRT